MIGVYNVCECGGSFVELGEIKGEKVESFAICEKCKTVIKDIYVIKYLGREKIKIDDSGFKEILNLSQKKQIPKTSESLLACKQTMSKINYSLDKIIEQEEILKDFEKK